MSCALGPTVSLHIECANQALSQIITGAPDVYAIGVVLTPHATFRVDGRDVDDRTVFIVPPGADFHLFSPPGASILACVIDRDLLDAQCAAACDMLPWHTTGSDALTFLEGPWLTERLRQDAYSGLRAVSEDTRGTGTTADLSVAFVQSFAASLLLNWSLLSGDGQQQSPPSFTRFRTIHAALQCKRARVPSRP